jgi:DNA polymerase
LPTGSDETDTILDDLHSKVKECRRCDLYKNGTVFSSGPSNANLLIIGEGPAKNEVNTGVLFSGPAGEKLNQILADPSVNLDRKKIYICNALKCKLPGSSISAKSREPRLIELANCSSYIQGQILAVNPKLIVCLGASAVKGLLGPEQGTKSMYAIHGQEFTAYIHNSQYPVLVSFHPASLLDRGDMQPDKLMERKMLVWEDWKKIVARLKELGG